MESPRVLHVMAGDLTGGAEAFFSRTVVALQKARVTQQVIIRANESRATMLRAFDIDVIELPFESWYDSSTKNGIKQAIQEFKPNIAQTWMYEATRAMPAGDYIHIGWLRGYQHLEDYHSCDHLICMAKGITHSIVQQGWPAERIHTIRPFAVPSKIDAFSRADLQTPEDVTLLLCLGQLHWHKAFDVALMALSNLPKCHLWLAGDGPLREELQQFAQDLNVADRVRFLGWQEQQAALFKAADICIVPSRYEPFGLVAIEAWAEKIPLVCTKAAGARAQVQDQFDGMTVPIDDANALAAAVKKIKQDSDLRTQLIENGFNHYKQEYSASAAADQYKTLYRECLQLGKLSKIKQTNILVRWYLHFKRKIGL